MFGSSSSSSPPPPVAPTAPEAPPVFGQSTSTNPSGGKPNRKSMNPTFLGAADTASGAQLGQKTLMGQ